MGWKINSAIFTRKCNSNLKTINMKVNFHRDRCLTVSSLQSPNGLLVSSKVGYGNVFRFAVVCMQSVSRLWSLVCFVLNTVTLHNFPNGWFDEFLSWIVFSVKNTRVLSMANTPASFVSKCFTLYILKYLVYIKCRVFHLSVSSKILLKSYM